MVVGDKSCVATSWTGDLIAAGATVEVVATGSEALRRMDEHDPDVVLLDLHLGGRLDAIETCRAIRTLSDVLVVFVAPHPEPYDEVVALTVGGDHCFACGTPMPIVIARLRSMLRRVRFASLARSDDPGMAGLRMMASSGSVTDRGGRMDRPPAPHVAQDGAGAGPTELVDGELVIDLEAREVRVAGVLVALTRTEFDLLATLAQQPRRVFTREQLLERVWDVAFDGSHVLDAHMSRLRGKIGDAGGGRVAFAVRGVGFRLRG
jgi:DNA-binding response OmpR family regulator